MLEQDEFVISHYYLWQIVVLLEAAGYLQGTRHKKLITVSLCLPSNRHKIPTISTWAKPILQRKCVATDSQYSVMMLMCDLIFLPPVSCNKMKSVMSIDSCDNSKCNLIQTKIPKRMITSCEIIEIFEKAE